MSRRGRHAGHTLVCMQLRAGDVPLQTTVLRPVRRPGMPWVFAMWMAVASAIALGGGLVLGLLAALQTGIGEDRWTQAVQAHGRLQLWGFAGVFIVTLMYEFIIRMNGRPPFPAWERIAVPASLATGTLLQAAGQLLAPDFGWLGVAGGGVLVAGSAWLAVSIARVRPPHSLRLDPQPWFFWLSGVWLVAAAAAALIGATQWVEGNALPAESHFTAELFLRGFVLQVILAVAPRAAAGHLRLPRLTAQSQVLFLVLLNGGTLTWAFAQPVWVLPGAQWLERAADLSVALTLLLATWWLHAFDGPRRWLRAEERYEWAVRLAWVGAVAYALGLGWFALRPGEAGMYAGGGVRHIFLLGFMLPLMLAMAHIVLERFGTGSIPLRNVLTAGFVLSLAAWPLRVVPALLSESSGEAAQGFMGLAGVLTMASLGCTMVVCFQTAARARQPVQRFLQSIPG